jgi:hypothetical protein
MSLATCPPDILRLFLPLVDFLDAFNLARVCRRLHTVIQPILSQLLDRLWNFSSVNIFGRAHDLYTPLDAAFTFNHKSVRLRVVEVDGSMTNDFWVALGWQRGGPRLVLSPVVGYQRAPKKDELPEGSWDESAMENLPVAYGRLFFTGQLVRPYMWISDGVDAKGGKTRFWSTMHNLETEEEKAEYAARYNQFKPEDGDKELEKYHLFAGKRKKQKLVA